jgi:hypothetical protein
MGVLVMSLPAPKGPVVAYDARSLQLNVRRYVQAAETNLKALESIGDQMEPLLAQFRDAVEKDAVEGTVALERISVVYDRLVKAQMNLGKAVDGLARLESFLEGGPDSRPHQSSMGEQELLALVVSVVKQLGITDLKQLAA